LTAMGHSLYTTKRAGGAANTPAPTPER